MKELSLKEKTLDSIIAIEKAITEKARLAMKIESMLTGMSFADISQIASQPKQK